MTTDADSLPRWFERATTSLPTEPRASSGGADIPYPAWGPPGAPGLVFVHGGAAHAHWWTHVAASFSRQYRVAAIDLSGHGDSGHRADYSLEGLREELETFGPLPSLDELRASLW